MNNADDILKKILLNMRYDASKTLKENKEIIFENPNANNSNLNSPGGKWIANKNYSLSVLGVDWTLTKGSVFEGWNGQHIDDWGDINYYSSCPGPKCIAIGTVDKFHVGSKQSVAFYCINGEIHSTGKGWAWFSNDVHNSELKKNLKLHFCGNPKSITIDPNNVKEIQLSSDNIEIPPGYNYQYKPDTNKKETQAKTQETKGAPTKEEILARTDAHLVAPRIYAESLGHKDWDNYKKVFCCPTYQENKTENIKCNQNIGLAMKQGWKPGSKIPDGMKSSYCKGDDEIDYKIEGDGSKGTDGDYSDLPLSGGL